MTINDLVTRALTLAGVYGQGRTPSAEHMRDGIATLNEMLEAWALDGMDMGLGTLVQTDDGMIDAAFVKGVRYNLAVELAGAHGIFNELPASVIAEAETQKELIRAALSDIDNMRCDTALLPQRQFYDWVNDH